MSQPLLLYSANTWLAYIIAERYYNDVHYVWCTPFYDNNSIPNHDNTVPQSSLPRAIYHDIYRAVNERDRHCSKLQENKVGILKGATCKLNAGIINQGQWDEISAITDQAELADFRPLVYVIPFTAVIGLLKAVPIAEKAHPLSLEYIIENLPRSCFDVVELARE